MLSTGGLVIVPHAIFDEDIIHAGGNKPPYADTGLNVPKRIVVKGVRCSQAV